MRIHTFESEQWIGRPIGEVFAFFADASNLEALTPPWLRFEVSTPGRNTMQQGTAIDYRLRLHGFPLQWRSVITTWEPPRRFVDEQVRGPYRLWRHEHRFEEKDGGTLIRDHVGYAVPGGRLVQRFFVAPDIRRIFAYRRRKLEELFGG